LRKNFNYEFSILFYTHWVYRMLICMCVYASGKTLMDLVISVRYAIA